MNEQLLKSYLLGELSGQEQRRLEELFCNDAQAFERLMAVEDDLIDDFVCGDLSRQQRKRFENHFLISPERRERLALAKALVTAISAKAETMAATQQSPPWWQSTRDFLKLGSPAIRFAMATASIVILVFYGAKETLENNDLRGQIHQLREAHESAKQTNEQEISQALNRHERLQEEVAALRRQNEQREQELTDLLEPPPQVLKAAPGTRGGTHQQQAVLDLQVAQGAYWVKLQLEFDPAVTFKSYRAMLQPYSGGEEVWGQSRLQTQSTNKAKAVVVMLPASIFAQDQEALQEYKLMLWGADTAEEFQIVEVYTFRVVKN